MFAARAGASSQGRSHREAEPRHASLTLGSQQGRGAQFKAGETLPLLFLPWNGGPAWCKHQGRCAGVTVAAGKGVSADPVLPPLSRKTRIPSGWDQTTPASPESTAKEGTRQFGLGGFEGVYPKKKPAAGKQEHGKQLPHTLCILLPAVSDGQSCRCQRGRSAHCTELSHCALCGLFSLFPARISLVQGRRISENLVPP